MPVVPFPDRAPLSLPRSKTPDPFVPPRRLTASPADLAQPWPDLGAAPALPPKVSAAPSALGVTPAVAAPVPWSPRHVGGPAAAPKPGALTAQQLSGRLAGRPFELGPAGPHKSLLDVLLMVQDLVLGERLRPFAPATLLGGAAARHLACSQVAQPAAWDVILEVPQDPPGRAAQAAAQAQRNGNKGRARHLAAALRAQGATLMVQSRTGATVLRVHLCLPGETEVPGALACEQLLLRCQNRAWSAAGGLSLPEAMALAASGQYRTPNLAAGTGPKLPQDVTAALLSLMDAWRLQQAGYRPSTLLDGADLAAVARLGDHLAQAQKLRPGAAAQAAIQLVHHTLAPRWAPPGSAPMRQQLGLAATAWAFLSPWQDRAPDTITLVPLIAALGGLCASHMDRACPDERLALAIVQGLCAEGPTSGLWRRLLLALPADPEDSAWPHVAQEGDLISVALPIWSTHLFVAADPSAGAPWGHLSGAVPLAALCAGGRPLTVGQRLAQALGCPPLAELLDHPVAASPQAREALAQALGTELRPSAACPPPIRSRLLYAMAVLGGGPALAGHGADVRAAFSLQQLCDAWCALPLPAADTEPALAQGLVALLRPHSEALAGASAPLAALRPVVHKLTQQLARRGLGAEALALLAIDPELGAQLGGQQALALLAAPRPKPVSPALEAQLLTAVARHKGASQALVHKEPALWSAWATRPVSSLALAQVFAHVEPLPQATLQRWLKAVQAAQDVAPLMHFVAAAGPKHPALSDALIALAQLALRVGDGPGLQQALATLEAARRSLTLEARAQVALPLLRHAQAQAADQAPAIDIAPEQQLPLAEDVLLGHDDAEARKDAMAALGALIHTPLAPQALGMALAQCDRKVLGQLSPDEIQQLFSLVDHFTPEIMPELSSEAADHFVDLLSSLPTTTAREAAAVAPLNVSGLTFLIKRRHFSAGQKLIELQMRSPAAVRLSLQAFQTPGAVDLSPTWRYFFDSCSRGMEAGISSQGLQASCAPPAPRFVLARLVAQGLRAELRAFEERTDHASSINAQVQVLDTIIYAIRRRHSLLRLLPDEPLLGEVAAFIARHDLGQQGLMRVYALGCVRAETDSEAGTDSDAYPQTASTPLSSVEDSLSEALKGSVLGVFDPVERAVQELTAAGASRSAELVDDDSLPIELWTVMLSGMQDQAPKVQQRWAHTSFQHTAGRSLLGALHGPAEQPPLSHREAVIASRWAAQLLGPQHPERADLPPLWPMLCCAHLEDPSAVLRLTQLALSMAEADMLRHPIAVAVDSLPLRPEAPLNPAELQSFQVASLNILMAALIVADTLTPQEFAQQASRLLDAQQSPMDGLSALPWVQVVDELKHLFPTAPSQLAHSVRAFEARCLTYSAHDALRGTLHMHAIEQQLDAWIFRLHRGDKATQRRSLNSIFSLLPTFLGISTFTKNVSINHILALLCSSPEVADLVREELLAAVCVRPTSFDGPDPLKLVLDIMFAVDPKADRTLGHFLAMERIKQSHGIDLPGYWPDTRRFFIGQTSIDGLRRAQEINTLLTSLMAQDDLPERRFAQQWGAKEPELRSFVHIGRAPGQRRP